MTYTNEDFERFYMNYKAEAVPNGETMQSYCSRNKVPYNLFIKWYKDTRHRLVEVRVDGMPSSKLQPQDAPSESLSGSNPDTVRIMADLRMSNGLHISRRNMSYPELMKLIKNLEVLC